MPTPICLSTQCYSLLDFSDKFRLIIFSQIHLTRGMFNTGN